MSAQISAIIPAFNAQTTLAETLDSIAAQTMRADIEVILVDDGSTDATATIAEQHLLSPKIIRVENGGAPRALNLGIEAAKGALICFLDADDIWLPEKTERQLAVLNAKPDLGFVLGFTEAFQCPSLPPQAFEKINYIDGPVPGYVGGTILARRDCFTARPGPYDEALKTGYFIEWFQRAQAAGISFEILDALVHKRRIR
ncbi:MAG: glycosyltransferase family A protein, partial [Pseudomonadota bacterium]